MEPVCETAEQRWTRGVCAFRGKRSIGDYEGRDGTVNVGSVTGKGQ